MTARVNPAPLILPLLGAALGCASLGDWTGGAAGGRMTLEERLARFAPVEIAADVGRLPAAERAALPHLVEAARIMDRLFLRQAWSGNEEVAGRLTGPARELFDIHAGLWDRVDGEPFEGGLPRPDHAGFYPESMTRAEFEAEAARDPARAAALGGLLTMVTRDADGELAAVPYSRFFATELGAAADHLRAAARLTADERLRRFLNSRAAAFLSDDYYQSDMDWMDQDGAVELTIGPYETYEDRLFGYKAAFEAFLTLTDPAESARLALYKAELPAMEANLPIPEEFKNRARGSESPIRVADLLLAAGDTRAGVQTIAFNLPNDERVREAKGSKKVLLKNVIHAKYRIILTPVAAAMLVPEQAQQVSADAFSNQTLFHELSHGLGPGRIVKDGRQTEVRIELKDLYSALEEAKADIMGVWNQLFMIEKGLLPESVRQHLFPTWLAGLFRSIRFGVEEAHGKANMVQFRFMLEQGAVRRDPANGLYAVDFAKVEAATRELVRRICVLQAEGDYQGTLELFHAYGEATPELESDLARLAGLPVDIRPRYVAAGL